MNAPYIPKRAEAGVVIGGYELVRRIGRGGMAEVWVARRALGKKGTKFVALKLIADHYVGDERYARMFQAESELAAVLSHANIVQVFDEGEEDGRSFLVMEWVDGLNLLKLGAVLALLDDEDRRFKVTSYIIGQLLYALGYAHSITSYDGSPLGVVHRDVSPQNVLVSNHGEVKLTDFGVAYHVMEESSGIHVKGKVRYMSPEQLSGKTRHPTVDLYAVGALLHELLDGKKFRGQYEDGQEMFTAVLSGVIPPLTRHAPPELDELRLRLLQPDPSERIQSAEDALTWLKRYPGHGDARSELTKLCGSLTGVVRPRAGPGQSGQIPMVDRRTTNFKGVKGLAKPRVNVPDGPARAMPPPPPPPPPAGGVGSLGRPGGPPARPVGSAVPTPRAAVRTSSTTAVKTPDPGATPPVISGQTECVRLDQLPKAVAFGAQPGVGGAGGSSSPAPAEVVGQASAPIPTGMPPLPSGYPPAPGAGVPGYPPAPGAAAIPAHAQVQPSHAIPTHTPVQGSTPIPHEVFAQSSYPIAVPANSPPLGVAPTERLATSEGSGTSAVPGGTEVVDANMILEIVSGSGIDQLPAHAAARDGTDTSREIPSHSASGTNSVSIMLPKKSAVAVIALGLVLVAVMSVTITWLLFTSSRDGGEQGANAAESQVAEATSEQKAAQKDGAEADEPGDDGADPASAGVSGEPGVGAPKFPEEAERQAEVEEPAPESAAGGSADEDEEILDEGSKGDDAVVPDPRQDPSEPEPKPKPKPKPTRGTVVIDSIPGLDGAQIRFGAQVFTIRNSRKLKKKLSAGKWKVSWRRDTNSAWRNAKAIDLKPGKTIKYFYGAYGPKLL